MLLEPYEQQPRLQAERVPERSESTERLGFSGVLPSVARATLVAVFESGGGCLDDA